MATARVTVPPILRGEKFAKAIELSVIEGLQVAGAQIHSDSVRKAPANTGALRQQLRWRVARAAGSNYAGRLVSTGPARQYADVMDKGRRPGARGPHARHVRRWVALKLRDRVAALAQQIAVKALPPTHKRASKRPPAVRALNTISFLVARKIHRKGIKGRRFATDARTAGRLVTKEIGRAFRARVSAARSLGAA